MSKKQINVKKRTRIYILLVGFGLFALALLYDGGEIQRHYDFWKAARDEGRLKNPFTLQQWIALLMPFLSLAMAYIAHKGDEKNYGIGIKDVITRTIGRKAYNLETDVIAASMTKQSVLAAIAAISVAVIQIYTTTTTPSEFQTVIKFLSIFGFSAAILFLLVSMVCYDYACRFHWLNFYKAKLILKALILDVYSWYILLTSFIFSIALIHPQLSILMNIIAGYLMWYYYFFGKEKYGSKIGEELGIKFNETVRFKVAQSPETYKSGTLWAFEQKAPTETKLTFIIQVSEENGVMHYRTDESSIERPTETNVENPPPTVT